MNLPPLISHPAIGPILIVCGLAWLAWITRKPEVQPVIYGADGIPYERAKHPVIVVALVAIAGAILISLPVWFYLGNPVDGAAKKEVGADARIVENHSPATLTIRYEPATLPIAVPSKSTAYILLLDPSRLRNDFDNFGHLFEYINGGDATIYWPKPRKKGEPISWAGRWMLTNHEDRDLINVTLDFRIGFREATRVSSADGKSWSYKEGNIMGAYKRAYVIPLIESKSTVILHLVNQTKLFGYLSYPQSARLQVAGRSEKETVNLIRPEGSLLDMADKVIVDPTEFPWPNLAKK